MSDKRGWLTLIVSQYAVRVARIDPFENPEESWTAEDLALWLAAEDVTHGIDFEKLSELAEQVNASGEPARNVTVATGTSPENGGWIPLLSSGAVVLPGEPILRWQDGCPGMTVRGVEVEPRPEGPSTPGANVVIDEAQDEMRAEVYGRVVFVKDQPRVEPSIRVSDDRLQVRAELVASTASDWQIESVDILRVLDGIGIVHGICGDRIREGLEQARAKGAPVQNVVVAIGTPSVDGTDGQLVHLRDVARRVGEKDERGRIDFRERGGVQNVEQGEVLCRVIRPGPSESGTDVFGVGIQGRVGEAVILPALENVTFDEDRLEFVADCAGGLIRNQETLGVASVIVIEGDVDFATGSLHADEASVHVKGNVLDRFEITTEGSVTVDGNVGDATILCGQNLTILGGLQMKEHGRVVARGSVTARFFQNATVVAGGDIVIGDSAIQCNLEASGRIVAREGRGRIIGGTSKARCGLSARVFGSETEVLTELIVEQPEVLERIAHTRDRFRRELEQVAELIGESAPRKAWVANLSAARRLALQALLAYRQLARHNLDSLGALRDPLVVAASASSSDVEALEVMHPGTRVTILGRMLKVRRPLRAQRIVYQTQGGGLSAQPLRSEAEPQAATAGNPSADRLREEEALALLERMIGQADRLELPRALQSMRNPGQGGKRVLVVDDHRLTRVLVCRMLERFGYTPFSDDGAGVFPAIMAHNIDLVMLDIGLAGGRSGIQILNQIKSSRVLRDLPVLMMTAQTEKAVIKAALACKANDLILKPMSMELVQKKVGRLFSHLQRRRCGRVSRQPRLTALNPGARDVMQATGNWELAI